MTVRIARGRWSGVVAAAAVLAGLLAALPLFAPGMAADLALFRVDTLAMAGGAVHDPVAAIMFCASPQAEYTIVNGRVVVREGTLTALDLPVHVERHNRLALQLANPL